MQKVAIVPTLGRIWPVLGEVRLPRWMQQRLGKNFSSNICLSDCSTVCWLACLIVCFLFYSLLRLSVCLFVYLSDWVSLYLFVCLLASLFIKFVYLLVFLSACLFPYLFICLLRTLFTFNSMCAYCLFVSCLIIITCQFNLSFIDHIYFLAFSGTMRFGTTISVREEQDLATKVKQ